VAGEPQLNPVLLYMLEELHSLRIDGPSLVGECGAESESGEWRIDPECAFASVERAAAGVPGFAVQRRVILANFQFAKLAMVEDLKQHGDALAASAVVAAIAGHGAARQSLARAVLEPVQLDARPADGEFLVLDADSTQQQAIVLASSGQSAVVQGPPGTGKSQTIANLIAQSVADGRRVLFVAEKRAALEAVIKRLSHPDVGLGHLMLDLHGASVSRREAMAQLARTLEEIRHAPPAEATGDVHREFEARRKRLNEHARRINAPRQPTGLSLNHILGRLLRLPAGARSAVRVRGEALRALTARPSTGSRRPSSRAPRIPRCCSARTLHPGTARTSAPGRRRSGPSTRRRARPSCGRRSRSSSARSRSSSACRRRRRWRPRARCCSCSARRARCARGTTPRSSPSGPASSRGRSSPRRTAG
jgi:hypothetical protein